jgi:hypothetical protein
MLEEEITSRSRSVSDSSMRWSIESTVIHAVEQIMREPQGLE